MTARQTVPGQFYQGVDEELSYTIDVANWNASPQAASVVVKMNTTDVSTSVLRSATSNPTISGSAITTPCLIDLTAGCSYRVEVKFTDSDARIWETYFFVAGET